MAIYHLHAKIIGRSGGRSAVAAAAYRSGERLADARSGSAHDYSRRREVEHKEILLPAGAPKEWLDRSALWNAAEAAERRKDAQVAREVEIALPRELGREERIALVRAYAQERFVSAGMAADIAVHKGHSRGQSNPHAHILLTLRGASQGGFGAKRRDWNRPGALRGWRAGWAEAANRSLEERGERARVDHRTLAEQGVGREPTVHLGPAAAAMERRGERTEKGGRNREIRARNADRAMRRACAAMQAMEARRPQAALASQLARARAQAGRAQAAARLSEGAKAQALGERREAHSQMQWLDRLAGELESFQAQAEALREERGRLGFFKGKEKREADRRIQSLEAGAEQRREAISLEYGIGAEPGQIAKESERLHAEWEASVARASLALRDAEGAWHSLGEACGRYRLAKAVDMAGYGGRAGGLEAAIAGPSPSGYAGGQSLRPQSGDFLLAAEMGMVDRSFALEREREQERGHDR